MKPIDYLNLRFRSSLHRISSLHGGSFGIRLIIAYKFVRAPIMLALALWLTLAPGTAYRSLEALTIEMAEGGAAWARLGVWLHANLSHAIIVDGSILAWPDGISTSIEGVLLLSGSRRGEWAVALGLACLLPFEMISLGHRPGAGKAIVLMLNAAIVIYLVRKRVLAARGRRR